MLGTASCALDTDIDEFALAVPFLLCPPSPAGGSGAIKFLSISCNNNFDALVLRPSAPKTVLGLRQ